MSTLPAPIALGHYDTIATRSRKGRSSFRVTARHPRYLVGTEAFRAEHGDDVSVDSITLTHQADAWIRQNDPDAETFPALLGTEARAFSQVIHAGNGAVDEYGVARHRADVSDGLAGLPRDVIRQYREDRLTARPTAPYTARQIARTRLVARRRKTDPGVAYGVTEGPTGRPRASFYGVEIDARSDGRATPFSERGGLAIVSAGHDPSYVWVGHRKVLRSGARTAAERKAAERARKATPAPVAPWAQTEAMLAPIAASTERAGTCQGVTVTLTSPDPSGRFRATLTFTDGTTRTIRARTLAPVARAIDGPSA